METLKVFLVLLMLSSIVLSAEEKGRRRKLRRKIIRRPVQEVASSFEPDSIPEEGRSFVLEMGDTAPVDLTEKTEVEENVENQQDISLIEEDRAGRGYVS